MKITKMALAGLIGLPLLALSASLLIADPLPDATYSINANDAQSPGSGNTVAGTATGSPLNVSTSINYASLNGLLTASSSAQIIGGNDPIVQIATSNGGVSSSANATLTYYFEVTSGGTANVPLIFAGTLAQQLTVPSNDFGGASIMITDLANPSIPIQYGVFNDVGGTWSTYDTNPYLSAGFLATGTLTGNDSVSFDPTLYVAPNAIYSITLHMSGGSNYGVAYPTNDMELDPTITIDPSFLALNPGDALDASPGFIPEPADFAVWAGAAALGLVAGLRFRRRTPAA